MSRELAERVLLAGLAILVQSACLDSPAIECGGAYCLRGYECRELESGVLGCVQPGVCGNLVKEADEACDDGNTQDGDICSADCSLLILCGNGALDSGEVCDDGNFASGDGCSADCLSDETCGNGYWDVGEDCDCGDGETPSGPGCLGQSNSAQGGLCRPDCRFHCGDGEIAPLEICDGTAFRAGDQCTDLGFDFGHIQCSADCGGLDRSDCGSFDFTPSPSGSVSNLEDIWGTGPDDIFAVGQHGMILHYDGQSWQSMPSATSAYLRGAWGSGPEDVFAVGADGIILHYDGQSWQPMPSVTENTLYGLWGSGPDDVFAVGLAGTILHYDGQSWQSIPSGLSIGLLGVWGSGPDDVFFVGASAGVVLHYDGQSWQSMISGSPYRLRDVWGSGPDDVFAVGDTGTVLHYDGQSWQSMASPTTSRLHGVWGSGPDDVFAVGGDAVLHYDGLGWKTLASGTPNGVGCVWGSGPDDVFAAGAAGAMVRYTGRRWETTVTGDGLLGVWGREPDDIFAVGRGGRFLRYDGQSWQTTVAADPAIDLRDVWASGPDDIFAVGDEGTVVHYDGQSWQPMSSGTSNTFLAVWGDGPDNVFATGIAGTVVHYDGQGWQSMDSHSPDRHYGVWGSGPDNIFAVADGAHVNRFNGSQWSPMSMSSIIGIGGLLGVWGSGPDDVFLVGYEGLHHDGVTWTGIDFPAPVLRLEGVWGSGPDDVIAVGHAGQVLHYDGVTWVPIRSSTNEFLYGVWVAPTRDIYMVGGGGTIYRLVRQSGGITVTARPTLAIPDGGYDGSLASMACVSVAAPALPVRDIQVTLGIQHARAGQLTIKLQSPVGTRTTLLSRPGLAESADDGQGTGGATASLSGGAPITFRMDAATDAETMGQSGGVVCADDDQCDYAPSPGAGPGVGLNDAAGENAMGSWQICVGDSESGSAGTIERIAVTFDGAFDPATAQCGNGRLEYNEQCDDGDTDDGDGCSAQCRFE